MKQSHVFTTIFLKLYVFASTLAIVFLLFSSFKDKDNKLQLDELTVKRVNVVSEDGSLRMVLSNETRQHPGRINGKDLPARERAQGILFFNNEGDECGGLTYAGFKKDGAVNSMLSFTADQYRQDQVLQILNSEYYSNKDTSIERGIAIADYPVGSNIGELLEQYEQIQKMNDKQAQQQKLTELTSKYSSRNRLFIGRTAKNEAGIFLSGPDGEAKLK